VYYSQGGYPNPGVQRLVKKQLKKDKMANVVVETVADLKAICGSMRMPSSLQASISRC